MKILISFIVVNIIYWMISESFIHNGLLSDGFLYGVVTTCFCVVAGCAFGLTFKGVVK